MKDVVVRKTIYLSECFIVVIGNFMEQTIGQKM